MLNRAKPYQTEMREKQMYSEGEITGPRAARFLEYAAQVGQGEVVSRAMMAERMGCSYSTARYNLERAALEGVLNKAYGFASAKQPGWIYARPEDMPKIEGLE
jgi:hypothetical protein